MLCFVTASRSENRYGFYRPGLKTGVEYEILCRGGRTPHMKEVRMLVVSLRGVHFGFWSHLGCTRQNAIIFSREGLV